LLSALESYIGGAEVTVVEQRQDYTRDVWFDFYPYPYSNAYEILVSLGIKTLNGELQLQHLSEGKEVITIRCNLLERFLAKILVLLGVNLQYNVKIVKLCAHQKMALGVSNR